MLPVNGHNPTNLSYKGVRNRGMVDNAGFSDNSERDYYRFISSKYFGVEPEAVNPKYIDLDSKMQLGYKYLQERNQNDGIKTWIAVWNDLMDAMEKESARTFKEFDEIFNGNQYVSNWIDDFDILLERVLNNTSETDALDAYGKLRIQLNNDILQFSMKDNRLSIENAQRAIADTYFLIGNKEKGEELFEAYLKDDPQWGWGWVGWSDQYWMGKKEYPDYKRGEEILLNALSIYGLRDKDSIEERLLNLYEDSGEDEKLKALEQRLKLEEGQKQKDDKYFDSKKRLYAGLEQRLSNPNQAVSEKIGRNSPCPCGSGKKYKKCCGSSTPAIE